MALVLKKCHFCLCHDPSHFVLSIHKLCSFSYVFLKHIRQRRSDKINLEEYSTLDTMLNFFKVPLELFAL